MTQTIPEAAAAEAKIRLEPCPFCGGEARMIENLKGYGSRTMYEIECSKCRVSKSWPDKSIVISHWNTRAPLLPSALAAQAGEGEYQERRAKEKMLKKSALGHLRRNIIGTLRFREPTTSAWDAQIRVVQDEHDRLVKNVCDGVDQDTAHPQALTSGGIVEQALENSRMMLKDAIEYGRLDASWPKDAGERIKEIDVALLILRSPISAAPTAPSNAMPAGVKSAEELAKEWVASMRKYDVISNDLAADVAIEALTAAFGAALAHRADSGGEDAKAWKEARPLISAYLSSTNHKSYCASLDAGEHPCDCGFTATCEAWEKLVAALASREGKE